MKTNTIFKFTFPFEVWTPVVDGQNINYVKHSDEMGHVTRGGGGMMLSCTEQLGVGWVIRDLQDRDGSDLQVMSGTPFDLYVHAADPEFDASARLIGWRHTVRSTAPRDVLNAIRELAASRTS